MSHDGVRKVEGLWSDGATMWVTDEDTAKIFAYDLATKERVPSRDFDTLRAAGNLHPEGLWSDGEIMWVGDSDEGRETPKGRIYAYDRDTKEHVGGEDFDTLYAAGNRLTRGMWS